MERIQIHSTKAATPGGPYSQAILVKNSSQTLHVSGQLGIDPKTGKLVDSGIIEEFKQIMNNVIAILHESGMTLENVVKINCYMADLNEFQQMNGIYAEYFKFSKPARTTFQVGKLPINGRIEIDLIAMM